MQLKDYDTSKRYRATVVSTSRITPVDSAEEVRELVLDIHDPDFNAAPGQTIGVLVPGPHVLGHRHHFRLYTVADVPKSRGAEGIRIDICVKRCHYIDEYNGEEYNGIASNFLCDRKAGDHITMAGPYGIPFTVPADSSCNLLMIGLGTGIAPFRAFVRYIYDHVGQWKGKVRLFYGSRTGLESLYMNDERDDFSNYYDKSTFQAFKAVSPRPHWGVPVALEVILMAERAEVWELLCDPKTYVYIAGLSEILETLNSAFASMAGGEEKWQEIKSRLIANGRWTELVYG